MRLLLVEDDDEIAGPLSRGLERSGFETTRVPTGADAVHEVRDSAARRRFDLVLLDLGLPDIDGFEVCRRIRTLSDVPVIMLTARGEEIDRVVGLELGADDYVVKPFGLRELVARIRAVTRRTSGAAAHSVETSEQVCNGELAIDLRSHRATLGDVVIDLTPKEFDLLTFLAREPGAARTRGEILDAVWDPHWYGPTKTLDVHVASLRKKLGDPGWIETVRGVGFRMPRR